MKAVRPMGRTTWCSFSRTPMARSQVILSTFNVCIAGTEVTERYFRTESMNFQVRLTLSKYLVGAGLYRRYGTVGTYRCGTGAEPTSLPVSYEINA